MREGARREEGKAERSPWAIRERSQDPAGWESQPPALFHIGTDANQRTSVPPVLEVHCRGVAPIGEIAGQELGRVLLTKVASGLGRTDFLSCDLLSHPCP